MATTTSSISVKCRRCGSTVAIDAQTNRIQPCENCGKVNATSMEFYGGFFVVFIISAMVYFIYYCITML